MHTFLDAKTMAKSLRSALAERHVDISHSDSLELVARQFGFDNWNILAARIDAAREAPLHHAWHLHQQGPGSLYSMAVDPREPLVLRLDARDDAQPDSADFGTLMQTVSAAAFRGVSLAFTAELRGEDVDRASVWMRVDAADRSVLAFDNLFNTPGATLSGSFDWTPIRVELSVADAADRIGFGAMLKGRGTLEMRAPRLTPVEGGREAVAA